MTVETVGWSAGAGYWEGWVGFIVLLVPTLVANLTTLLLITFSHRLNRSSSTLMVRYLAAEDGAFSAVCLIQCALNLSQLQLVGHMTGCQLQAVYGCFFTLSAGYTLCCIAYHNEQRIGLKPGLSQRGVLIVHLLIWSWSGFIALLCSFFLADARLMPSGTYCFANLLLLRSGLTFYLLGVALCGAFLAHRYWRIYRPDPQQPAAPRAAVRRAEEGGGAGAQHQGGQAHAGHRGGLPALLPAGRQRQPVRAHPAAGRPARIPHRSRIHGAPQLPARPHPLRQQTQPQTRAAWQRERGCAARSLALLSTDRCSAPLSSALPQVWMNAATRVALWEFLAGLVGRRSSAAAALTSAAGNESATMNGGKVLPAYQTTVAARVLSGSQQHNAQRQKPSQLHHKPRTVSAASAAKAADDSPSAAGRDVQAAAEAVPSQAASPLELMWRERHLTDPLSTGLVSQEESETQQDERQQDAGGGFDSLQPLSPHAEDERQERDETDNGSVLSEPIS